VLKKLLKKIYQSEKTAENKNVSQFVDYQLNVLMCYVISHQRETLATVLDLSWTVIYKYNKIKKMETQQFLTSPATIPMYVISATDLKQAAEDLISRVIERTKDRDSETYLSRKAVSEMLDVTFATLWRWEREKYLLPIHVGRKVRYRKADVMRILKEKGGCHD